MEERHATLQRLTNDLIAIQQVTQERPYSIKHRLVLAEAYRLLGYPDLAAGDAYKALLLIDEVAEDGEYHEEALEAAKDDFIAERLGSLSVHDEEERASKLGDGVVKWAKLVCLNIAYCLLIRSLLDCDNLRSAYEYINRARKAFPDDLAFQEHGEILSKKLDAHFKAEGTHLSALDIDEYPDKGFVRREQYAWNKHEPKRSSDECLEFLNNELASIAPKLEVRLSELPLLLADAPSASSSHETKYVKQLGVFAKEDIAPGEQILEEKSLLTAISRLHDLYCDACSIALPTLQNDKTGGVDSTIVSCEECEEVFFCSVECHDLAQDNYHPSLCGASVEPGRVRANEAADKLYTSLLTRALALAETQGLHPLELKEIRYIWGDYHGRDLRKMWNGNEEGQSADPFGSVLRTLPFSFKSNVLAPLHMLEKMDVNIFTQSDRYDTWIFNTIFAKLRGTASAQQGLDGRPEIGAVHPMWSLANHSCDPNVSWEWKGSMRLWTRETLVEWQGRDSEVTPGIKKGEEVFSHYCDVRLPVKERREWAAGALGGECVCSRCNWEEAEQLHRVPATQ